MKKNLHTVYSSIKSDSINLDLGIFLVRLLCVSCHLAAALTDPVSRMCPGSCSHISGDQTLTGLSPRSQTQTQRQHILYMNSPPPHPWRAQPLCHSIPPWCRTACTVCAGPVWCGTVFRQIAQLSPSLCSTLRWSCLFPSDGLLTVSHADCHASRMASRRTRY